MGKIRRELLPFEGRYLQMPNEWARDKRISLRARGILAELLSHKEGWEMGLAGLVTERERDEAVRTAARELEAFGYLVRERKRDPLTGKLGAADWVLRDPMATQWP